MSARSCVDIAYSMKAVLYKDVHRGEKQWTRVHSDAEDQKSIGTKGK